MSGLLTALQTVVEANTTNYQSQINVGKWIAIPLIFLLILIACFIPHLLVKLKRGANMAIALCTCISGGALLGIGLMHILPHANEYWSIWLTPEGCGGHEGHAHNVVSPVPIFEVTQTDISPRHYANSRPLSPHYVQRMISLRNGTAMDLQANPITFDQNEQLALGQMSPSQSIEPVNPITLIPSPERPSDVQCPEGHLFPYAELCCGLIIMVLMATETILHRYLAGRGPGAVHLHDHSDGDACGHDHGHDHNDNHTHTHNHHGASSATYHPDGSPCADVELQSIGMAETCASPTSQTPALNADVESGRQSSTGSPIPDENDEKNKKLNAIEELDVDEHGRKLSPEEMERMRFRRTIDAYLSALAISLHCIFNGLSLGVFTATTAGEASSFWTLFGATVGHKLVDGFSVSLPLLRANLSTITTAIVAVLVAISTPVGILIGYFASNVKTDGRYFAQALLMSLSSGSFFYIALLEMIPNGVKGKDWVLFKWFMVFVGFGLSAIVAKWA